MSIVSDALVHFRASAPQVDAIAGDAAAAIEHRIMHDFAVELHV